MQLIEPTKVKGKKQFLMKGSFTKLNKQESNNITKLSIKTRFHRKIWQGPEAKYVPCWFAKHLYQTQVYLSTKKK